MAGAGPKKRLEENTRRLASLRIALAAGLVLHLALRLLLHRSVFAGFGSTLLLLLSTGVGWFCYSLIAAMAAPVHSDTGELLDGGADLSMRGMCGHYHDVLYVTVFAQAGAGLSGRFWLAYLLVPGYGLWLLWRHILKPYFFPAGGAEGKQSEAERKKLERTADRADRRRQKSMSKR